MRIKSERSEEIREGDVLIRRARIYKNQSSAEIHIPPQYAGKYCKVVVLEGV
ncbi:MAG: hypothetical protein MASP_00969 [Candidatus Methanolliviera sp. GoM_asphalt]|nr:MAG: hypothetical protein MASP_00969 [Candidatus Methanolliviera sp. GoM_asphalt]